ncbi:hypothetical protein OAV88_01830 [bacterium]|nr:hypothetical protein [bacterium]
MGATCTSLQRTFSSRDDTTGGYVLQSGASCAVSTCDSGYTMVGGSQFTCTEGVMTSSPSCEENKCTTISSFGQGVQSSGGGNGCEVGVTILSLTSPSCDVECATGFYANTGTYTCDTSTNGNTPSTTLSSCAVKTCDPIGSFPNGIVPGDSGTSCTLSMALNESPTSPTSCTIKCDVGYSGGNGVYVS